MDYTQAPLQGSEEDSGRIRTSRSSELIRKVICAVPCWECLLECRLCPQLVEIRTLEDRLNGTGDLTDDRSIRCSTCSSGTSATWRNMQARVDRIKGVLAAWEKPSDTLGDVLEKNGKLIEDTQKIIATDPPRRCTTSS